MVRKGIIVGLDLTELGEGEEVWVSVIFAQGPHNFQ